MPRSVREQSVASVLKCARDWTRWARHFALFLARMVFPSSRERTMVMPMGYARQTDAPGKPFDTRRYLVGFLGSIENRAHPRFSPKRLVGTPKHIARSRMVESFKNLPPRCPTLSITEQRRHSGKQALGTASAIRRLWPIRRSAWPREDRRSRLIASSRGCRQGCVVICNRLPPHWFYVDCPAIQIDDWGNLEAEVRALAADPQRLSDLHRETLAWWRTKLSAPAIGGLIAKCLESPGAIEEPVS